MKRTAILLLVVMFLSSLLPVSGEVHAAVTFTVPEILGCPTDTSVTINVVPDDNGYVYFEYSTASGVYTEQTSTATLTSGTPTEVVIGGLTPNTRYYYRTVSSENGVDWIEGDEHSFHTQRPPGSLPFTFTIIADSHMNGGGGNESLYIQTLDNVADDNPDFHFDLGDTFFIDGVSDIETAKQRYLNQREWMGAFSPSVPIFIATGNHEQEEGWNFDDTPVSEALLGIEARKLYYPNPVTDGFYSGNTDPLPVEIGGDYLRENYYAWEWGDALFVVIDPYHYTMANPYGNMAGEGSDDPATGDRWNWTLGQQQFDWFKQTLEDSDATFKFVFAHHMVGGSQDYVRGGAGPAYLFEWGGYEADETTWGFDTKRSGWGDVPIHQFMIDNGVSAFFHGHDHQYVYEKRDGIVYQLVPQPSTTGPGFSGIYSESDPWTYEILPNGGHLRVTVSPDEARVEYVATSDGSINHWYTIEADTVNDPPEAVDDSTTTSQDTLVNINVLTNDSDPNGDPMTVDGVSDPSNGTAEIQPDDTINYTPDAGYIGSDSFTYDISDGNGGMDTATVSVTITGVFANILLGRPTDDSITVNLIPDQNGDGYFEYGTEPGVYGNQTGIFSCTAEEPVEVVIDGLVSNTQYYYRMRFKATGETEWAAGDEHSFYTQRASGETFTFTIIADSHLGQYGGQTSDELALYEQTLLNVDQDSPDFHIDLGDTFPMDPSPMGTGMTEEEAEAAYLTQRPFMGLIGNSIPIFLILGNHENEEGWNFDDTFPPPDVDNLALLSLKTRKLYYPNPAPDGFYTGNTDDSLTVGDDSYREDYYAWEWGDALFVVLDPYQYTMIWPSEGETYGGEGQDGEAQGDRWDWTLGIEQYLWLKDTLENSDATFKFVFSHQVTGGVIPYGRGGTAAAPYFEWGGYNWDDTWGFDTERPAADGWDVPIHQLMVANGVDAFFHGHDHIYAMEELDGIIYLECPKPDDAGYDWEPYGYGYTEGCYPDAYMLQNSGHIRVTVSPLDATVEYVRSYLPEDGTNGEVAHSFTILADGTNSPPTADAGDDQTVEDTDGNGNEDVTLDGSGSADMDGTITNYVWSEDGSQIATSATPTVNFDVGTHTVTLEVTDDEGATDSDTVTVTVVPEGATSGQLEFGVVTVGSTYVTVNLAKTYISPVVVCTIQYDNNTTPVVARVSNVTPTSFDVRLQNPSDGAIAAENVNYLVVEEGAWTIDGVKVEAQSYLSTVTDQDNSWVGESQSYLQSYTNPVVLGQVMSENDPDWSVFWCQGSSRSDAPSATTLKTGKTIGEDTDVTRADETIGFIVFEEGHSMIDGIEFEASVGTDSIQGVDNRPPYEYNFDTAFTLEPQVVVATMVGVDGMNGGWAYLHGSTHVTTTSLYLSIDEDQIGDSERNHITEQVSYAVFSPTIINEAPVADDQAVSTEEDTAVAITLTASDVEGDPLSYIVVNSPSHGTLVGTAPNVTYMPELHYNGPDSFTFKANDGVSDSNVATVSITVTPENDAPVADDQAVSTEEDTPVAITLTANDVDGDALTYQIVTPPTHGTLSGTAPALTYTPDPGYLGSDSFTFEANDGVSDSNIATVSITVTEVNHPPVADDQAVSTEEDTPVAITLTANDVDGDALTYEIVGSPSHGALSGGSPGITYTPDSNYNGPDSFTFKANDGVSDSNVATVSITVTPENDAPVADDQAVSTEEDTPVAITLTANDVDGDALTYQIVTPPTHGTLSGTAPALSYTPDPGYLGSDSFTFEANDGVIDSASAQVDIQVNPLSTLTIRVYIADIYLVELYGGWRTYAEATIAAVDNNGEPMGSIGITGHWEGATFWDNESGYTAADGMITFNSHFRRNPRSGTEFIIVIDTIDLPTGYELDADSVLTGTITVP